MNERVDVVVVGAGLSGLVAARDLVAAGRTVRVLEARDRVGGRTWNTQLRDGSTLELGGEWVGPGQREIMALLGELGIQTYPTVDVGDVLTDDGSSVARGQGMPWDGEGAEDIALAIKTFDSLARTVDREAPWRTPDAERLDALTFGAWVEGTFESAHARDFLRWVITGLCTAELETLSLLHVLVMLGTAGGSVEEMVATRGGAQQDRIIGGSQLPSLRMAEELGDRVKLSAPVRTIRYDADGVTVEADDVTVEAARVVVAIPPTLAGRITYDPPLPAGRDQMTQRFAQGSVVKAHAIYDRAFWRDEGLSGKARLRGQRIRTVVDNTPTGSDLGVLTCFVAARPAVDLADLDAEERRSVVLEQFVRLFGDRAAEPLDFVDVVWADEEWSRGAFASFFGPGGWTTVGRFLREPIGPIHWAGSETARRWYGYMDGAVEAGHRAAAEVVASALA